MSTSCVLTGTVQGDAIELPATDGPWTLPPSRVAEWTPLYPGVDVAAEVARAAAWLRANPGRQRHSMRVESFLVSWLNRAAASPSRPAPASPQRRDTWAEWSPAEKEVLQ